MKNTPIVSAIAVLDDRRTLRQTIMRSMKAVLPSGWECVECPLLQRESDYPEWLLNRNVRVLVADQVLNEQAQDSLGTVDYKGHDVTIAVRRAMPNFPIYIVTAYSDDDDLSHHDGDVEDVVRRSELTRNPKKYVLRMLRAGQRFQKEYSEQMAMLAELSMKVATCRATPAEKRRLHELQVHLSTPCALEVSQSREEALQVAEQQVLKIEKLCGRIEVLLREQSK